MMEHNRTDRNESEGMEVEGSSSNSTGPDAVEALPQVFPQVLDRLVPEFEMLTGKRLKTAATRLDLKSLERKLRKVWTALHQLEKVCGEPLTPESAKRVLELLNRLIRSAVPRIPGDRDPTEYLIREVEKQSELPANLALPHGLDYGRKHLGLRAFIEELLASVDRSRLDAFLEGAITGHQLVSQFQRILGKTSLPKELRKPPARVSRSSAERLKMGLRDVTADWDALVNLVYGLVQLKQGQQPTWGKVRRVSLWDKVIAVRKDSRLVTLSKQEWVTVRNSLDHGLAFFDPAKESIEFPDRNRRVSWPINCAFLEGIDIYLANSVMLRTWNFVRTVDIQSFKERLALLEELAQSRPRNTSGGPQALEVGEGTK